MAKSAQQRFNEYLDECRDTSDAVREFVNISADNHKGYAYPCGALQTMITDLIAELPKARRAEMREEFRKLSQKHKNELLARTIKEA
jgi:hypothetical protein